jgi:hypothetical protein
MISAGVAYDIDVLKLGHHGSNTSTSQAFLDATTPSYAVVSAGRESQFGHPHQGVVDRVLAAGATLYHTDTTTGNDTIVMGSDCETVEFYADPWTPGGVPSATPTATTPASTSTPTATATTGACGGATAEITALDKGGETVSVTGTGNMTGWYLISESGSQRFDFPNGFTLNGTVTIYSGTTQFPNTPTSLWWSGSNFWNNSSDDDAFLYNCTGGLVDVFEDGD